MKGNIVGAAWVPGLPHLLHPGKSPSWGNLAQAYQFLNQHVESAKPDTLLIYSTQWISVLGTSFQGQPNPKGIHVDENWYEWGDLAFDCSTDSALAKNLTSTIAEKGYPTKLVDYENFPIDTGTIVALNFLNPESKIPVSVMSSWVYADAESSRQIGIATREAIEQSGRRVFVIACSLLSAHYFDKDILPHEDRIHSPQEDSWNKKMLGFWEAGDWASAKNEAQIYTKEAMGDMQFNAFHWLGGALENGSWAGHILSYGPLWGTGAAVVEFQRRR